jgi:addiction module HigA family antidote
MKLTTLDPRMYVDDTVRLRSPGQVLRDDYMVPEAITAASLARRTGTPLAVLRRILGGAPIKTTQAIRLAAILKTSALYWLMLQARYDLERAVRVHKPQVLGMPP